MDTKSPHLFRVYETWARLQQRKRSKSFELDGESLHIADVASAA
jgi:hypothetical protein